MSKADSTKALSSTTYSSGSLDTSLLDSNLSSTKLIFDSTSGYITVPSSPYTESRLWSIGDSVSGHDLYKYDDFKKIIEYSNEELIDKVANISFNMIFSRKFSGNKEFDPEDLLTLTIDEIIKDRKFSTEDIKSSVLPIGYLIYSYNLTSEMIDYIISLENTKYNKGLLLRHELNQVQYDRILKQLGGESLLSIFINTKFLTDKILEYDNIDRFFTKIKSIRYIKDIADAKGILDFWTNEEIDWLEIDGIKDFIENYYALPSIELGHILEIFKDLTIDELFEKNPIKFIQFMSGWDSPKRLDSNRYLPSESVVLDKIVANISEQNLIELLDEYDEDRLGRHDSFILSLMSRITSFERYKDLSDDFADQYISRYKTVLNKQQEFILKRHYENANILQLVLKDI